MSQKKNSPTPPRPRKPQKGKSLTYRQKGQRFIIATFGIVLVLVLAIGMLISSQGTVAGNTAAAPRPAPPTPTASAPSTASPSPEPLEPQDALKLQAAAVALYLTAGIGEGDPNITPETTALPARIKGGQKAPEISTPVSFRITEGSRDELIVCARASLPDSGLIDAYFIYPLQYEDERATRCPQESPTKPPAIGKP